MEKRINFFVMTTIEILVHNLKTFERSVLFFFKKSVYLTYLAFAWSSLRT